MNKQVILFVSFIWQSKYLVNVRISSVLEAALLHLGTNIQS
jgi:hypothetical protein